jgi:Flp pilus assembly pilin Flp
VPGHNRAQFQTKGKTMKALFVGLLKEEQGQDLIEYTLLIAFVALASAAVFIGAGGSIQGIWTSANVGLSAANQIAAS